MSVGYGVFSHMLVGYGVFSHMLVGYELLMCDISDDVEFVECDVK